jgi:hypothetical protein
VSPTSRQYLIVPENKAIVSSYQKIWKQTTSDQKKLLFYFHLAQYATLERGTKIWTQLEGFVDQDVAVMKEYLVNNPSDSVSIS